MPDSTPGNIRKAVVKENIGATDINLTPEEIEAIDRRLDSMPMSEVFGGSRIVEPHKA